MPFYCRMGNVPPKKHVTFKKEDGSLYREELFSTKGFAGIYSTLYRDLPPTQVEKVEEVTHDFGALWEDHPRAPLHCFTGRSSHKGDILTGRQHFFRNKDCAVGIASFENLDGSFYRNSGADEILFVHKGSGELHSEYGVITFGYGDYLVIPRGIIYRFENLSPDNRFFLVESTTGPIETPKRYRNEFGQLLEHSPFNERDIRPPEFHAPVIDQSAAQIYVVSRDRQFRYTVDHHPFDVVGWDGYFFPWAFSIKDFEPIVGRIHQPPPVHQVFQAPGFVVCNFVPRLFDFHPDAIPAPYYHQNVDSDEILYYVEGEFMSRKGIEEGSITMHPGEVPHGPQPGKYEGSVGVKDCYEYAVMVDTFAPLYPTKVMEETQDKDYYRSWLP